MKTSHFNKWLASRVEYQSRIVMSAIAGMLIVGVLGLIIQGGILYLILRWYGTMIAILMIAAIYAGLTFYTAMTGQKTYRDKRHKISVNGVRMKIRVAPTIANGWNFAFGSIDSDQSIPEWLFSLAMIVPRMFWTAWRLMYRIQDVDEIDVEDCSKVLRMILKKAERVEMQEIADQYSDIDLPTTMRQVSLIDGVVFLAGDSLGVSLANRFRDDLEKWLNSQNPNEDDDDDFYGE